MFEFGNLLTNVFDVPCTGFVPKQCGLWSELFRSSGVCGTGPTRNWWSLCLVSRRGLVVFIGTCRLELAAGHFFPERHGVLPGRQPGLQQ